MHSTPNPKQTDPHDLLEIAPDVVLVAHADKAHDARIPPSDSRRPAWAPIFPLAHRFYRSIRRFALLPSTRSRSQATGRWARGRYAASLASCWQCASVSRASFGRPTARRSNRWSRVGRRSSSSLHRRHWQNRGSPSNRVHLPFKHPPRRPRLCSRQLLRRPRRPPPRHHRNRRSRCSRWRVNSQA